MANHVAPGENGYNLLSKRHIFRVVILNGLVDSDKNPVKGPLVLEAKDGSYRHEIEFSEALKEGRHLIFEFQVRIRDKEYFCYIKDALHKFEWDLLPVGMIGLDDIEVKDQETNWGET